MKDAYSKIVFGFFFILLVFFVPTIMMGYHYTLSAQTKANVIVEEFVDNCRSTAYINENEFTKLQTDLQHLGLSWKVEVYHYSPALIPISETEFLTVEAVKDYNDIASVLYQSTGKPNRYNMKKGDRIEVVATSTTEYTAVKLAKIFLPSLKNPIYISCGERIDNSVDLP